MNDRYFVTSNYCVGQNIVSFSLVYISLTILVKIYHVQFEILQLIGVYSSYFYTCRILYG